MKEMLLGILVAVLKPSAGVVAKLLVDLVKKSKSDLDDKAVMELVSALSAELAKKKEV